MDKRTPAEVAADKKKHKDEKRMRQKLTKGGKIAADYESQQQKKLEATEHNRYLLDRPRTFHIPRDVTIPEIRKRAPALYEALANGNPPRVTQHDDPYRARAIWLNDYDKKHTFSRRYQQCRMMIKVLQYHLEKYENLDLLGKLFLYACIERKAGSNAFNARDTFISEWLKSDHDLPVFQKRDLQAFDKMKEDLEKFLPVVANSKPQSRALLPTEGRSFAGLVKGSLRDQPAAFESEIGGFVPRGAPFVGPTASPFRGSVNTSGKLTAIQAKSVSSQASAAPKGKEKQLFGTMRDGTASTVEDEDIDDAEDDEEEIEVDQDESNPVLRTWGEMLEEHRQLAESTAMLDYVQLARMSQLSKAMVVDVDRELLENALNKAMSKVGMDDMEID